MVLMKACTISVKKAIGLIVLKMISSASPKDFWNEIDLENIEPLH
jgi:hypothetical protein